MLTRRSTLGFLASAALTAVAGAATVFAAERVRFDRAAFEAALAAGGPVLIDVYASWCPTCRRQEAIVLDLVADPKYAGFKIFVIDYDTEKDLMRAFGAQQRSTLIAFKNGVEVGRIVGDTRPRTIEALLASTV